VADVAYASRANLRLIQRLDYWYVWPAHEPGNAPRAKASKRWGHICQDGPPSASAYPWAPGSAAAPTGVYPTRAVVTTWKVNRIMTA
jgi:hypothetical protein